MPTGKELRLPVRHSVLNPIQLAWAGLKNYIPDKKIRISDSLMFTIWQLDFLAAVDGPLSTSYFQNIKRY